MTRPISGGRRRVDRVLNADFVEGLHEMSLADLRERRKDAEQEEADLSYIRRMLHGRMDLVVAEQKRRGGDGGAVIDSLSQILGDEQRTTRGLGRYLTVEPSRVDEHRRDVEQTVADAVISDVAARSDEELAEAMVLLRQHEAEVSDVRHQVQAVVDLLSSELTGRYRDGGATVDDLLAGDAGA